MKSCSSFLQGAAGAVLLAVALAGCASSSVNWSSASAAESLAGRKTFLVVPPRSSLEASSLREDFHDAVTLAIIAALKDRGYTPVTAAPADFSLEWGWIQSTESNPGYFPTQPQQPGAPVLTINTIALSMSAVGADKKDYWRSTTPFPVRASQWSPNAATTAARQTLQDFPPYRDTPSGATATPVAPAQPFPSPTSDAARPVP